MISNIRSRGFLELFVRYCLLWSICLGLFTAYVHAAPSVNSEMELLDNTRPLKISDRLWYHVIEEREKPSRIFVNNHGYVSIPLLGDVYGVGKTPRQLAYEVKSELEKDFFHNATVIIQQYTNENVRGEITILGEVSQPGKQNIPADQILYVSEAILAAGNFSREADGRSVTVVRQDPENPNAEVRFIVDVAGILATGKYEYDMPVEPDDLIIVPKLQHAGGQVYITGEVKSPGLYPIPQDANFTVSRAILAAGGFTDWAKKDKVKLIRAGDDMSPEERTLIVNVEEILFENIRSFDPEIKPGDVIRVEESFIKF